MNIDFSQAIMTLDDRPVQEEQRQPDGSVAMVGMTLKSAAVSALQGQYRGEEGLSGTDKMKRFNLALKIFNADAPLALKADEIDLIKQCVAKGWPIAVVGRVWPMLDTAEANG